MLIYILDIFIFAPVKGAAMMLSAGNVCMAGTVAPRRPSLARAPPRVMLVVIKIIEIMSHEALSWQPLPVVSRGP